ncbi:MAG TPA: glycosyltransferase [Vicinamibacterales bacterium]
MTITSFVLMGAYVAVRLTTIPFDARFAPSDRILAVCLLWAELFLCMHGVGYFTSVLKAARRERRATPWLFARRADAPVAVLIASFNESEDVLAETIASTLAMDYPRFTVYLLDDSTKPESREGAARLARAFGIELVTRTNRAGYKAGAINDLLPRLAEPYVAILDADQRPRTTWLRDIVPLLEESPALAFVQVPQVYVNTRGLPVARAAAYQQAVFFEYICEGKSDSNAMFCCGSNVVMRREALMSVEQVVGGRRHFFDETSVTEDFATTVRLHAAGWRTAYVNRHYVVGMGPETLPAYFTQQMRWAMGTLGVGLRVIGQFFRNPRQLTAGQWWEYMLSGTYYFVGFATLIFMIAPVLFVGFDVRPLRSEGYLYLIFFVPYIVFTMNLFFFGMALRRYSLKGVWLASALSFATFRTYIKAALVAVFGLKRAFGVTPKGVGGAIPLYRLWPELVLLAANLVTAAYGYYWMSRYGIEIAYAINTVWATYHAVLLSTLFVHFNRPVVIHERQPLFEPAGARAA